MLWTPKKMSQKFIDKKKSSIMWILGINIPLLQQFRTNRLFHVRTGFSQIYPDTTLVGAVVLEK